MNWSQFNPIGKQKIVKMMEGKNKTYFFHHEQVQILMAFEIYISQNLKSQDLAQFQKN